MPLPYKGPDSVLMQLLGFCVDAGKQFAAVADMQLSEIGSSQTPVGTTMALMERGTKVMSAVHKRLHYAQKKEFQLLLSTLTIEKTVSGGSVANSIVGLSQSSST